MPTNLPSDPLSAFEAAEGALRGDPGNRELQKTAVLALARGGATAEARRQFARFDLAQLTDDEDALALHARLLKDVALRAPEASRGQYMLESAEAYEHAWQLTKGHYSAINAATQYLLSGETTRARTFAREALSALETEPANPSRVQAYFRDATRAEAFLILGQKQAASQALGAAIGHYPSNIEARATTLHQFARILGHGGERADWLDPFRPRRACHFAGRIRGIASDEALAQTIKSEAAAFMEAQTYGSAFGALAAGSDVILAEALLEAGCDLHVVLPCPRDAFVSVSVAPFGEGWTTRFDQCLQAASSVTCVTNDDSLTDGISIHLAGLVAIGRALTHAAQSATIAEQILVAPTSGSATERLGEIWQSANRPYHRLAPDLPAHTKQQQRSQGDHRQLAAMLFADLRGFGKLTDDQVLITINEVMAPLADHLSGISGTILHLNTWGDGMFVVYHTVEEAAEAALSLQDAFAELDIPGLGLPPDISLRLGAHYGPVSLITDPFTKRPSAYGSQVAYAARIEPLAVPGSIWVSETFATTLAITPNSGCSTDYVGRQNLRGVDGKARLFALLPSQALSQCQL